MDDFTNQPRTSTPANCYELSHNTHDDTFDFNRFPSCGCLHNSIRFLPHIILLRHFACSTRGISFQLLRFMVMMEELLVIAFRAGFWMGWLAGFALHGAGWLLAVFACLLMMMNWIGGEGENGANLITTKTAQNGAWARELAEVFRHRRARVETQPQLKKEEEVQVLASKVLLKIGKTHRTKSSSELIVRFTSKYCTLFGPLAFCIAASRSRLQDRTVPRSLNRESRSQELHARAAASINCESLNKRKVSCASVSDTHERKRACPPSLFRPRPRPRERQLICCGVRRG